MSFSRVILKAHSRRLTSFSDHCRISKGETMKVIYKGCECEVTTHSERITRFGELWYDNDSVNASMEHLQGIVDDWANRGAFLQLGDDCPKCGQTLTTTNDGDQWCGEGIELYCPGCHYMPEDIYG